VLVHQGAVRVLVEPFARHDLTSTSRYRTCVPPVFATIVRSSDANINRDQPHRVAPLPSACPLTRAIDTGATIASITGVLVSGALRAIGNGDPDRAPHPSWRQRGATRRSAMRSTPSTIHQLKVTLEGASPPVWRTVQMASETSLSKLHMIFQIVMGWTNSHLYQFEFGRVYYGEPIGVYESRMKSARTAKLAALAPSAKSKFSYEYDFGDGWRHRIGVEHVLAPAPGLRYPGCLGGSGACPPEDCGGIYGYAELLDALRDPDDPEHDTALDWLGEDFDPVAFDLEAVDKALKSFR
jgi:hypothetical protein